MIKYKNGLYSEKLLEELMPNLDLLLKQNHGVNCLNNVIKQITKTLLNEKCKTKFNKSFKMINLIEEKIQSFKRMI